LGASFSAQQPRRASPRKQGAPAQISPFSANLRPFLPSRHHLISALVLSYSFTLIMSPRLIVRQAYGGPGDNGANDDDSGWFSDVSVTESCFECTPELLYIHEQSDIAIQTGEISRYAIVGGIIVLILAWMVGGYYHAQRRLRQGKPPLLYHRWLVPKSQRYLSQVAPSHTYPQYSAPPARQYGHGNILDQGAVYREQEYNLNSWNHPPGPPGMYSIVHGSVLHAMLHICYVYPMLIIMLLQHILTTSHRHISHHMADRKEMPCTL